MKKEVPLYANHRRRIKNKYLSEGLDGWYDYEVLELLLFYAIPRKDTKPIAKNLLKKFGNLSGVISADVKELKEVEGVSAHSSVFLKMIEELTVLFHHEKLQDKDLLNSPKLVSDYLKSTLKYSPDEQFRVLFLNTRNRLIKAETLHTGTVNRSVVYPRKVVERALYHHSTGVILSHNHPAGSLTPSPDDIEATKSIRKALDTVEVNLLDHIIIGGNGYFSFAENGINF